MSDLITDEMVETATRANYDAMTWPGAWAELDSDLQESGGERAAMRAALEEVAPLIVAPAPRDASDALEAVLALHRREERWGNEDYSIDATEYADRKKENDEVDAGWGLDSLSAFDVCAECYRVEQSIEQRLDDVAVLEGLWPCPTVAAIEAALRGES